MPSAASSDLVDVQRNELLVSMRYAVLSKLPAAAAAAAAAAATARTGARAGARANDPSRDGQTRARTVAGARARTVAGVREAGCHAGAAGQAPKGQARS